MRMSNPLNTHVARLLGLKITTKHVFHTGCTHKRMEDAPFEQAYRLSRKRVYAGDKPLRSYHKNDALAIVALEQICDERDLLIKQRRIPGGDWLVRLSKVVNMRAIEVAYGRDTSLAMAIVLALGELGKT